MRPTHTFQRKQRLNIPLIKKKLSDGLVEPFLFVPVNLAPLSLGTPTSHASSGSSHLAPAQDAHAEGHGLGWPTWFQELTTQVNSYVINHAWYILRCPLFQGIWFMIRSGWDWLGDQTQGSRSQPVTLSPGQCAGVCTLHFTPVLDVRNRRGAWLGISRRPCIYRAMVSCFWFAIYKIESLMD